VNPDLNGTWSNTIRPKFSRHRDPIKPYNPRCDAGPKHRLSPRRSTCANSSSSIVSVAIYRRGWSRQGLAECVEELLAVFVGVIGIEADAKQASVGRYGRWADGGNEDPCIEEFLRETESFVGVMDVEGNDRSGVAGGAESSQGEFFA